MGKCGGRLRAPYQALLNAYYVQGCSGSFRVWLSSVVILLHIPPPPTISISLSPLTQLTGNTAGEVRSPGPSEPSVHTIWSCLGGGEVEASCLQESQGPSGVALKTGLGAAPLFWLPGRGFQHYS